MTEGQKNALMENLLGKSVRELIEMLIVAQEEIEEAKKVRRRFKQILNLCLDTDQRRKPGRPKKRQYLGFP